MAGKCRTWVICFLALVLYRFMRMRLKANGNTNSPKVTLELLRRLQTHRVHIGKQCLTGIGTTTPRQLELFAALGIKQPSRHPCCVTLARLPAAKSGTYAISCGTWGAWPETRELRRCA